MINALYSSETNSFSYKRPVKAVALDPEYSKKNSRQFATGGLAAELILNEKGWFSHKDTVLHAGEGTIHSIKWRGSLIAWANDVVYFLIYGFSFSLNFFFLFLFISFPLIEKNK